MSAEDLDNYETDAELALYREYRDVIKLFTYVCLLYTSDAADE